MLGLGGTRNINPGHLFGPVPNVTKFPKLEILSAPTIFSACSPPF